MLIKHFSCDVSDPDPVRRQPFFSVPLPHTDELAHAWHPLGCAGWPPTLGEQLKQPLQRTVFEPATIPGVNRISFPKFPGQIPPGNPRSRQVEQGLQEIAVGSLCGSAPFFSLGLGQAFLENGPHFIHDHGTHGIPASRFPPIPFPHESRVAYNQLREASEYVNRA